MTLFQHDGWPASFIHPDSLFRAVPLLLPPICCATCVHHDRVAVKCRKDMAFRQDRQCEPCRYLDRARKTCSLLEKEVPVIPKPFCDSYHSTFWTRKPEEEPDAGGQSSEPNGR